MTYQCPECEGRGGYYRPPTDYWEKCDHCSGYAVVKTPEDHHWVKCPTCAGKGNIKGLLAGLTVWRYRWSRMVRRMARRKQLECPYC